MKTRRKTNKAHYAPNRFFYPHLRTVILLFRIGLPMICRKSFFAPIVISGDSNPHIILISVRQPEGARGFESFSRCQHRSKLYIACSDFLLRIKVGTHSYRCMWRFCFLPVQPMRQNGDQYETVKTKAFCTW